MHVTAGLGGLSTARVGVDRKKKNRMAAPLDNMWEGGGGRALSEITL